MAVNPRRRTPPESSARDRILTAAYPLFLRRGVKSVGVDEIIAAAGVAKATFYRQFSSKDALIVAFFRRRELLWTHQWLETEATNRGASPRQRLLAIFELFDEWFHGADFDGCPYIGTVANSMEPRDRVRDEAVAQLAVIREFVGRLAGEAGIEDRDGFAVTWQVLMAGSIVLAMAGVRDAARGARHVGELILSARERAAA